MAYKFKNDNAEYNYFVVVDGLIAFGAEYKEDAQEMAREYPQLKPKIYTRKFLKSKGCSPAVDQNWMTAKEFGAALDARR